MNLARRMILAPIEDPAERERVDKLVSHGPSATRTRPAGWQDDRTAAEQAVLALRAAR